MKQCAIDGFKKHTQKRFKDRCIPTYNKNRKNKITELSDDDYFFLCDVCKTDSGEYPAEPVPNPTQNQEKINRFKKIVNLNGLLIWCVYHKRNGIVRTVIPVTTKDMTKILEKRKNETTPNNSD